MERILNLHFEIRGRVLLRDHESKDCEKRKKGNEHRNGPRIVKPIQSGFNFIMVLIAKEY